MSRLSAEERAFLRGAAWAADVVAFICEYGHDGENIFIELLKAEPRLIGMIRRNGQPQARKLLRDLMNNPPTAEVLNRAAGE